jgi:hypothetical protein
MLPPSLKPAPLLLQILRQLPTLTCTHRGASKRGPPPWHIWQDDSCSLAGRTPLLRAGPERIRGGPRDGPSRDWEAAPADRRARVGHIAQWVGPTRAKRPQGDKTGGEIAVASDAGKLGSNPVAPTFFRKKPFGENVEGRSHCGDKSCAVERAVQTRDFEDSTLCAIIGGKPLLLPECLRSSKTFAAHSAVSSWELTPTRKKRGSSLTLRVAIS